MFPTVVIRALFVDTKDGETVNERVLVMQNCPISFAPGDWIVTSNKIGAEGAGIEIDDTMPVTAFVYGRWVRVYNTDIEHYGGAHAIEDAENSFRADGWEVLSIEEGRHRFPWAIILHFDG